MVPLKDPSVYTDVQMCQTVPPLQTDTPPPVEEAVCQLKCIFLVILSTLYLKKNNQNSFIYHTTKANQMLHLHSGGGTAAQ